MKKMILTSLAALSLLAISADAREYKCDDKDVIIAGFKAEPIIRRNPDSRKIKSIS